MEHSLLPSPPYVESTIVSSRCGSLTKVNRERKFRAAYPLGLAISAPHSHDVRTLDLLGKTSMPRMSTSFDLWHYSYSAFTSDILRPYIMSYSKLLTEIIRCAIAPLASLVSSHSRNHSLLCSERSLPLFRRRLVWIPCRTWF